MKELRSAAVRRLSMSAASGEIQLHAGNGGRMDVGKRSSSLEYIVDNIVTEIRHVLLSTVISS